MECSKLEQDTVLFEEVCQGEHVRIACGFTASGGFSVTRYSAGPLTQWYCGEANNVRTIAVSERGVYKLLRYFDVADPSRLPPMLCFECTGTEGDEAFAELMDRMQVPCGAFECHGGAAA